MPQRTELSIIEMIAMTDNDATSLEEKLAYLQNFRNQSARATTDLDRFMLEKMHHLEKKNRMLVNYHIKILDDADLISMEKEGRRSMVYTTGNAETYLS